uniref:Uncharacterized protein n=1 Tax=Oryza rufipogon TaxID=4529 RepID=A0A0E0QPW3_ORYRU
MKFGDGGEAGKKLQHAHKEFDEMQRGEDELGGSWGPFTGEAERINSPAGLGLRHGGAKARTSWRRDASTARWRWRHDSRGDAMFARRMRATRCGGTGLEGDATAHGDGDGVAARATARGTSGGSSAWGSRRDGDGRGDETAMARAREWGSR